MNRTLGTLFALVVIAGLAAAPSAFAAEPGWHSETPVAAGIGVPSPLGEIADIEFWAPNRGVLITAGNAGIPAGVYAYDGAGWHRYSTVCGGHEGRIAWAGPDEFWTVSDYATRQEGNENPSLEHARTLCHFKGGEVVASYAEPLGAASTYRQMKAAACDGPDDCWFAGEPMLESAPNIGPFHLHWDGGAMTAIPSLTSPQPQIEDPPGTITGLEFFGGALYETATEEPFLREASLAQPQVFSPVPLPEGATGPFRVASDGGQLWVVGESGGPVLRSIGLGFEAVPSETALGPVTALATEPNGAGAWVGGGEFVSGGSEVAKVTRVGAGGEVSPTLTLPEPAEELGGKGSATAIACPAAGQCWLGTDKGWLFHLGGALEQDTDPAMHVLITSRPADNSTHTFVSAGLPPDTSGETESSKGLAEEKLEPFPENRPRRSIVFDVHQKVIGKRVLQLSFKLRASAHVQLLAKSHHKVVAKTRRMTLAKGPHRLRLKLDPKNWPTGLDFQVHPAHKGTAK